mgnify:CR=1 FL=1
MAQVEAIAHLAHLAGSVSAEEERIVGHVEEVLAVVVDDVDALVGGLRESLRRLHVGLRPLVVGIGDAFHAVLVHKEIVYLCHIVPVISLTLLSLLRVFCSIVSGNLAAKLLQFFESSKCFAIYIRTQGNHGVGATRRLFRICRRLLCLWLVQTAERIFCKRPNKSATNDRTKSQQTTEKVSKDLYNSIIISIFAAKLSNKRKMTICINQE